MINDQCTFLSFVVPILESQSIQFHTIAHHTAEQPSGLVLNRQKRIDLPTACIHIASRLPPSTPPYWSSLGSTPMHVQKICEEKKVCIFQIVSYLCHGHLRCTRERIQIMKLIRCLGVHGTHHKHLVRSTCAAMCCEPRYKAKNTSVNPGRERQASSDAHPGAHL